MGTPSAYTAKIGRAHYIIMFSYLIMNAIIVSLKKMTCMLLRHVQVFST